MAVRKKSRKKRKAAASRWKVLAAAVFLLAFLIASLSLLHWVRQQHSSVRPPARGPVAHPPVPTPPALPAPPVVTAPTAEDLRVELESMLLRSGVTLQQVTVEPTAEFIRYRVRGSFPAEEMVQLLRQRLQRFGTDLTVEADRGNSRLAVLWQGKVGHLLLFEPIPVGVAPGGKARVAIIMDDLGMNLNAARELVAIDLPITGAVMPETEYAAEVAQLLYRHRREVMVHIPMEPQDTGRYNPGRNALLMGLSEAELQRRLLSHLAKVPHAVGGNNHMGSRLTEDAAAMKAVMAVLREKGLFFVDSVTSAKSVALAEARLAGLPTIGRDVFLDNEQNVEAIRRQLHKLIRLARSRGQAVGICHPYPEMLEALRREAGAFREMGVTVVPVSALLQ